MRKDSYESILSAVGRVLDHAEARGFAIRGADNGLHVDTFDGEGKPRHTLQLGLGDLVELLEWSGYQDGETLRHAPASTAQASTTPASTTDAGTLSTFLARHTQRSRELVGTH